MESSSAAASPVSNPLPRRKNQQITYTYDQLNRLTEKTYPDSATVNYTYDNDSRLTQVSDPTGTYQFTFDHMGRLTGTLGDVSE
jgi:YD repeat-containing protein